MLRKINLAALCFAVALFFACTLATRAQDSSAQQSTAEAHSGMHQGQHMSRLEWMSKELNLTEDQKTKLKPVLEDENKQMQSLHSDTTLTAEQKRDKMKDLRQNTDSQINQILTPDQQKKYEELKSQQKMHHEAKPDESKPQS
jgi:periplasmic protein CpxP/Spy